ncbi:SAM-dependent methyltransferase [Kutzneria kofuensis]|uniref:SAM-dependent methyltransferase n=1 Tax=Kutzneria kofuensis TaxID=103725 RepID=UPI0031EEDC3E
MTQQADWDIVTDVGITALAVAAARAIESHRANPLVSDPYAELFVAAARPQPPMPTRPADAPDPWQDMGDYLGVRSRFFDEYFAAGATRQAVLLAAGLDVRGYRLDWPAGTVVYELDVPKVLQFKQNVLADNGVASRTEVRNVDVDLRDDWPTALQRAGFDRTAPTSWLAEGLLPFLPNDAVERLFTSSTSCPRRAAGSPSSTSTSTSATWPTSSRWPTWPRTSGSTSPTCGRTTRPSPPCSGWPTTAGGSPARRS